MTHPNLILNRKQFSTIHIHTPRSRNVLTKSYKFGHYRSFLEVNKNTFFPKLITCAWNIKMKWYQKGWLEYISRFLKSPRTLPKVQNWRSYALLKLGIFPKVNYPQNSNFWQRGPIFSTWISLAMLPTCPTFYFHFFNWFFIFYWFYWI